MEAGAKGKGGILVFERSSFVGSADASEGWQEKNIIIAESSKSLFVRLFRAAL